MSDFLKGNFKVKNEVVETKTETEKSASEILAEKFEKAALSSIGGSMVYVKRTNLTWNGQDESKV